MPSVGFHDWCAVGACWQMCGGTDDVGHGCLSVGVRCMPTLAFAVGFGVLLPIVRMILDGMMQVRMGSRTCFSGFIQ